MVAEGTDILPDGQPIAYSLSRFAAERVNWCCSASERRYRSATLTASVVHGASVAGASSRLTTITFCRGVTLP